MRSLNQEQTQVVEAYLEGRMSRREFMWRAIQLGLSMSLISTLLAGHTWFAAAASGGTPRRGGTVVLGVTSDVNSLDPGHTLANFKNLDITLYDKLVDVPGPSTDIRPALATSWTISPDGKAYTFKLRRGVKFHDGTPFNAEAVKFTWDRMMDKNHPYHNAPYPYLSFFYAKLAEVRIVDQFTVRFTLKEPDAVFLANLTWLPAGVVSPAAVKKYGKKFDQNPVGTGPFRFVSWKKDRELVVERNPEYWGGAPLLARVIIKSVPDEATRVIQLQKGEIDVVADTSPEFIPLIQKDKNLQIQSRPGLHTWWIAMNEKEKPFGDKRVRQALNYAVDKDAIIRDVLKGGADVSRSFVWPGTWAYEPNVMTYPYNPAKARELLAASGYPRGFSTKLVSPVSGSMMVAPRELATIVQAQLRDVGIEATIQTMEWTTYTAQLLEGKVTYGLAEQAWGNNADDPGQYIDLQLTTKNQPPAGYNFSFYSNPRVDKLLEEASVTVNRERRRELYREAQRVTSEEAPWIFMFHAKYVVSSRRRIQGLVVGGNFNRLGLLKAYVTS